jgi:flavin reductase (DIM6/NTAB) family NADH-FMN oxidoreductase RutF
MIVYNWFQQVSFEPQLVTISVKKHHTHTT